MLTDIIFNGCSIRGISFVGTINKLSEEGYTWNNIAGVSSGSLFASLIASGYTAKELKDIITNFDFSTLLSRTNNFHIPYISDLIAIKQNKGVYNGDSLYQWIHDLLKAKGIEKFKDVCDKNGKSRLKLIAVDVQSQQAVIFPDDLQKYDINPMEFEIAKAVRASTAIPLFFEPFKLEYKDNNKVDKIAYFCDGGLISDMPVWLFDIDNKPSICPTFAIHCGSGNIYNYINDKTPLKNYLTCIADAMIDKNETIFMRDKDSVRTIFIDGVSDISTFNFDVSIDDKIKLYNAGYKATEDFLKTWNFQSYINKYRMPTNNLTSNRYINKKHYNKRRKDKGK